MFLLKDCCHYDKSAFLFFKRDFPNCFRKLENKNKIFLKILIYEHIYCCLHFSSSYIVRTMTITFNSLLLSSLSPTVISPNKPHLIYIRIIMNYCTTVVYCLPVHLSVCRSVALRSTFNPWEIPKKSPRSLDSSALLSHACARVGPCAYVLPLTHTHTRVRYVCVCKDCARSSAVVGSRRTVTMNGCL